MAEEAMADIAGATRTNNWQRIKDKHGVDVPEAMRSGIKAAFERFLQRIKAIFDRLFGKTKFTDAQVHDLVENAWQATKESKPDAPREQTRSTPLEQRASKEPALDSVEPPEESFREAGNTSPRRPGESQRDYARRILRKERSAILKALDPLSKEQKIGRANFREMLATRDRNLMIADYAFDEARKMFDRDKPEQNLATIDQWETGQRIIDPDARQFFESLNERFANLIDRIRAHDPDALHNLIADPAQGKRVKEMRAKLLAWMEKTGDPEIEKYRKAISLQH